MSLFEFVNGRFALFNETSHIHENDCHFDGIILDGVYEISCSNLISSRRFCSLLAD